MMNCFYSFPVLASIPRAPPIPEEPSGKMPPSMLVCEICGKTFKTHSELDRHKEHMHGHPEKTHTQPHAAH